jgi:hypothetical protein
MPLHLQPVTETKPEPKLVRLPKTMLGVIREYAAAKEAKKEADKASRNAENTIKSLRDQLTKAMEGQASAVCEHVVLTLKQTADAAPSLTMNDGSTVKWELVTNVLIGNRNISTSEIKSIYGGRSGSLQLDVTGA